MCRSMSTMSKASRPEGSAASFSNTTTPSLASVTSLCPQRASTAHATFMFTKWSSARRIRMFLGWGSCGMKLDMIAPPPAGIGCRLWSPRSADDAGSTAEGVFPRREGVLLSFRRRGRYWVSPREKRSAAEVARSFCRRACCTGFGRSSASLDEKKSSTSSSPSFEPPADSPPVPPLPPEGLAPESQLLRPMSPQLLRSSEEQAKLGHVMRINAGQWKGQAGSCTLELLLLLFSVDTSGPSPLPYSSSSLPPMLPPPLLASGDLLISLPCADVHCRIALMNVALFSATTTE
mmetsp:Transcript_9750/g.24084  ORF Transcript_9750/g.24084 Transcript_9750/m.24084 type:complete len:291 (-) Transcript_9750:2597-3469(-)